jgi:Mlc titration factor MtfA (ptsG expression regulator)
MPLLILALLASLLIAWFWWQPAWVAWQRARVGRQAFPEPWRRILRQRVPLSRHLPPDLQQQLKKHIQIFLAEKPFIGCAGLVVTDEMRVTIAAQACLLLLNQPAHYFPSLRQVLVYPGAFRVERRHVDDAGIHEAHHEALSGESWAQGQVVLSWADVKAGARHPDDGYNVVIHEFAHQLDQENGAANGAPFMRSRARRDRWAEVLGREYAALQSRIAGGEPSLIDAYGATNPAEFFAVVSEFFFERPRELAAEHPGLYAEFSRFYRVNPLSW